MRGRRSQPAPDLGRVLKPTPPGTSPGRAPAAPAHEATGADRPGSGPWASLQPHDSPAPFRPKRGIVLARVEGDALQGFDVRGGDDVVLVGRPQAEHGDLVALPLGAVCFPLGDVAARTARALPHAHLTLWKVYPEPDRLRLSRGDGTAPCSAAIDTPLFGVVVGVVRRRNE